MYSVFSKAVLFLLVSSLAWADAPSFTTVANGKDSSEAMVAALRAAIPKKIKADPAFMRSLLANEILPNPSNFIMSYKILDGTATAGNVSVESKIDLGIVQSLFSLTPKTLGLKQDQAKALILFQEPKIEQLEALGLKDYFAPFTGSVKEFLTRRKFSVTQKNADSAQLSGEDPLSPELLRTVGKSEAVDLALGLSVSFETEENENTHTEDTHIVLQGTLVDILSGVVLAKNTNFFIFPKVRKELLFAEYQRLLSESARDFSLSTFIQAGQRFQGGQKQDFLILEVKNPSNPILLEKLRIFLENTPDIKSILEYHVERGSYQFAVQCSLDKKMFTKKLQTLHIDSLELILQDIAAANAVSIQVKEVKSQETIGSKNSGEDDYSKEEALKQEQNLEQNKDKGGQEHETK